MYTLETKEYYKIKCPILNSFKNNKNNYEPQFFKIASYLSGAKFTADAFESIEGKFVDPIKKAWLERNSTVLNELQNTAKSLKKISDTGFYTDAFIYTNGIVAKVLPVVPNYSNDVFVLSGYMLDISSGNINEAAEVFGQEGYDLYLKYLPQTIGIWPAVLSNKKITKEEKNDFSDNACVLVDYILSRATFSCMNVTEKEVLAFIKKQVLCYYKFLRDNKIYLPKELQEKVYKLSLS